MISVKGIGQHTFEDLVKCSGIRMDKPLFLCRAGHSGVRDRLRCEMRHQPHLIIEACTSTLFVLSNIIPDAIWDEYGEDRKVYHEYKYAHEAYQYLLA